MQVFAQAFWVQKAGNDSSEYEDACWPEKLPCGQGASFRFAAADGATETSFSRIWALQLVRSYCKGQLDRLSSGTGLGDLQQRWSIIVRKKLACRQSVPWYTEEKIRMGAFASILGITFSDDCQRMGGHGEWQAMALGDACFVQVGCETVLARFPLENSASFNNRPHLLSSDPTYNDKILDHLCTMKGAWRVGDVFFLMTDALACWFLREVEEGRFPWRVLRELDSSAETKPFSDFVGDLRSRGAIRNDDVTLLRLELA
jgi:hypothetical protein